MRTSTTLSFSRVSRYRLERDLSSLKISSPSSEISQKIVTTLNEISRERHRLEQDVSFFQISSPSNELYQERYCLERDLSKRYSPESILKRVSMSLERCHYRFERDPRQRCHHLLEHDISWELFVSRETSHFGRYHLPRWGISREYCREIVNTSNNVYQDRDIAFSEMSHTLFGCLLPRAISLKRNILFLKRILLSSGRPWTISLWEISPRPGCILFLDIISFERYLSRVWSQGSIFSREYYPESYSQESILDSVFPRQE